MIEKCYLCGSTEVTLLSDRGRGNVPLLNKVCKSCGLAQRLPRPTQEEVDDYYAEGAFMDENQDRNYPRFFKSQYKLILARAQALKECLVKNNVYSDSLKILEIGSHIGTFLAVAGEVFPGAQVYGIEPDTGAAEFSRSISKAKVYNSTLEEFVNSMEEKFDVVCSFTVLEHVYDPRGHLNRVRDLLNPHGSIFLEVPNMHSHSTGWPFWYDWYLKEHLFHYSGPTITRLLAQAGFVVRDIYDVRTLRVLAVPVDEVPAEALEAKDDYKEVIRSHDKFKTQHLLEQFKNPKRFLKFLLFLLLGHNLAFAVIRRLKEF